IMNMRMTTMLFAKDIYLSRRLTTAYLAGGVFSAALLCVPRPAVAFVGFLLVVTACIGMGMQMIGELIFEERKSHTQTFVMSLPVTALDYAVAKMAVVVLAFILPWSAMFLTSVLAVKLLPWIPDGKIPFTVVLFLELLAGFTCQLAVAVA